MVETIAIIAVVIVVLVVVALAYAATKPDTFRVQRSTSINAPPEKILPLVKDLRSHGTWSPWEKKDPAMKRTYSGAASGKGAVYEWDGNKNIGKGRMEITDASPSKVVFKMDFLKPFEAHNMAEITMTPQGESANAGTNVSTNVTWAIYGPNLFLGKVMGLVCNMDKMIGREFETGLANLKTLSEK
jgi:Polyketide cyclase / dehydrase and lipid transport